MKKINLLVIFYLTTNYTLPVAADQVDMMIDMSVTQMKSAGELSDISKCLGVTEAKFLDTFKYTMRFCADKHGFEEESEQALNTCFSEQSKQGLGVSESVFKQCEERFAEEEVTDDEIDYSELSEEQFEQRMKRQQQQSKQALDSMMAMSKAASRGTEDQVTLPIYTKSEIISHYTKGMTNSLGKNTLPIATFISRDSVDKVVKFYQKELPDFELDVFQESMYTFIKEIPANFNEMMMDTNMPLYSIPHVEIYGITVDGSKQTNIAITYKR